MASAATAVPLSPRVAFPQDTGLDELWMLFDQEWVCSVYRQRFGEEHPVPERIRIRQVSYTPGRMAMVSYIVEWEREAYLPSQHFVAWLERGKPVEVFRYPDDPRLPGLKQAADPAGAIKLINKYVLSVGARRTRVEAVRYRPGSRAVLRYSVGRMRFYGRVIRPATVSSFLKSWEPIARSGFAAPRIAGYWADGGVVWMSEIPGKNLRSLIRRGLQPDPGPILDGLTTLWATPNGETQGQAFDLSGAYHRAKRSLLHVAQDDALASLSIGRIAWSLDTFVESWRPSAVAHNDFYDDQILVLPDGGMALVDFEEAGPGDPMLDVGNFTAHLRWRSRFGRKTESDGTSQYLDEFRAAALERFGWRERDLNLREAVCLFRICTNAVRHPQHHWRERLGAGLTLASEVLE